MDTRTAPFPAPEAADDTEAPLCLLNGAAHSGAAEARHREVAEAFAKLGRQVRIEKPPDCGSIERRAREAAEAGAPLVIAGGGDGTMSAVANALAGSGTALAVLPLGTLNHFAKDLGVPLDIVAAAGNAFTGTVRKVDVGEVNGRVFVNNSSIGLYPRLVRQREALEDQGHGKWSALIPAAIAVLRRSSAMRVRLTAASRTFRTTTDFLFAGNNEYDLSALNIGARLRLDGGELWVCHLPHTGRFRVLWEALRALAAVRPPKPPFVFPAPEFQIALRKRSVDVAVDGEVVRMQTPLRYRSRPGALRVIAPLRDGA